ncbi:NAD(P)-dependent oxidoreductase [Bacillus horti]|uniref:3-hydroxyisobutyrate dehydrogenase/2-hydroxy-3-oxopropionate reductase n=1 Tax=Caldalkalibacillus horti TaxID=77523 RepID=A0ABT9W144_9BACI|nr:NAD(P)-dependent oxidoreductase [Bacillus horti]MDQ0166931.1 3-hydroxyisobutyrate dehydrogenase/2-hydroxy-3-oxopropionate reductase [Bacillus horti]
MKVGYIGLGTMGLPMVKHLIHAGYETWVVSRSRQPIEQAIAWGAKEANHPQDLAEKVDMVMTCLPSLDSVELVYFGENGIVQADLNNKLVFDFSTVSPELNRKQDQVVRQKGGSFLDAPLSGGPMGAEAGTLTIMCGGEQAAFDQALPVLEKMGKTIEFVGQVGSGSVVKLLNNMLVGIHTAALSEAFVMGAKAGINPALIHKIIKASTGHSFMIDRTIDLIQDRDFKQRFMVDLLHKDMKLATELATELEVNADLGKLAEEIIAEVTARGYGKQDISAIIRLLEEDSGVEVHRKA